MKINRYRLLGSAQSQYEGAFLIVCAVVLALTVVSEVEVVGSVVLRIVVGVYDDVNDGTVVDSAHY